MITQKTASNVSTAIHGLMYVAKQIDQALLGEERHLNAQQSHDGPFAQALNRLAGIVDGAPVENADAARADLLFCFPMLHLLGGGFYSACWDVLARAHEILADQITEKEAEAIVGRYSSLSLDATLGHIHLLELGDDGLFHTYDATFLGKPYREIRYARFEIEARKPIYDMMFKKG